MKKKLFLTVFVAVLMLAFALPVSAAAPRMVDEADMLTDYEETELNTLLDEISSRQQCDVVVVAVSSLDGMSVEAFTDDYYDYNGYGMGSDDSGIMLLISMEDGEWQITTYGYGITAVNDAAVDHLADIFIDKLNEGDFVGAFKAFANECDELIGMAKDGHPYGTKKKDDDNFNFGLNLPLSLGAGLLPAWAITAGMKSKHKSVLKQYAAASYTNADSTNINASDEMFLYSEVVKTKKNTAGTTHTSSSGREHGGGGGKFKTK